MKSARLTIIFSMLIMLLPADIKTEAQNKNIKEAFTLTEKDIIPEGIAYDAKTRTFYVSSIYKNKIVSISPDGKISDFKKNREDGLYSTLGMKVDPVRNQLWVCAYAGDGNKEQRGDAGIFKYDLESGRLIKKYILKNQGQKHLFNDIAINKKGDAYFTDSDEGKIYSIRAAADKIEEFFPKGILNYPNGIALSPDEKYLFVADNAGLHRIGLNGEHVFLKTANNISAAGCDGIYFYRNSIVAVQNDFAPERIVRFRLNEKMDAIESMNVLCVDNPLVKIPTTGVIVGNEFYLIGNSQLDMLKEGEIKDRNLLKESRIVKIKL